jgi:hypothetical protein
MDYAKKPVPEQVYYSVVYYKYYGHLTPCTCYTESRREATDSERNSGGCSSNLTKLNSVAFSPQANYTDRATAPCQRS